MISSVHLKITLIIHGSQNPKNLMNPSTS